MLVLYLPGFGILARERKRLEDQEIITLSLALGCVLFVLAAFALSFLNLRFLLLPLIIIINSLTIIKYRLGILKPWKVFIKDKIFLILIILGILIQGFINFPSGYLYNDGLHFWSSQGHDGLWHVSVMESIKRSLPPQNPGFGGELLYNYHYLVDVLMGEFYTLFPFFSSLDLYFRFFPVIFSLFIGTSVFAFVSKWKNNTRIGYLAIFFTYFVGSFGYVVTFLRNGNFLAGETVFWAAQQNTLLGNPPHAISHGILASFLLSFLLYLRERSVVWILISFVIGSTLAGFKVSGGFVMLIGLTVATITDFVNKRKFSAVVLALLLGLSNLLTFKFMTAKDASSFLMFLPWWFIRTMVVDKLGWMDLEFRRQHYLSKHTWNAYLRVLQLETTAFLIFLAGNLGMRIIGIVEIVKNLCYKKLNILKDPLEVMIITSMLTGFIIPVLFVQKGLIYNNIQFIQYFLFLFGFYGAISTYHILSLFRKKIYKIIIMLFIIVFSIPTVIGNLVEFYGPGTKALSKITNSELTAIKYLKDHSLENEVVLNTVFNPYLKDRFKTQPWPIYAWYDTPYTAALSGRASYLASEHVTLLFYPQTKERIENKKKFFEQTDLSWNKEFLKKAKISYVYIAKIEQEKSLNLEENGLEAFFENDEIIIYKVKKQWEKL